MLQVMAKKDEEKSTSWDALKAGVKLRPGHRTVLIVPAKKSAGTGGTTAKKPAR